MDIRSDKFQNGIKYFNIAVFFALVCPLFLPLFAEFLFIGQKEGWAVILLWGISALVVGESATTLRFYYQGRKIFWIGICWTAVWLAWAILPVILMAKREAFWFVSWPSYTEVFFIFFIVVAILNFIVFTYSLIR